MNQKRINEHRMHQGKRSEGMQETLLHFYHSKIKLLLQIIFLFLFIIGGFSLSYVGRTEQSFFVILLGLFIAVVFSFFWDRHF